MSEKEVNFENMEEDNFMNYFLWFSFGIFIGILIGIKFKENLIDLINKKLKSSKNEKLEKPMLKEIVDKKLQKLYNISSINGLINEISILLLSNLKKIIEEDIPTEEKIKKLQEYLENFEIKIDLSDIDENSFEIVALTVLIPGITKSNFREKINEYINLKKEEVLKQYKYSIVDRIKELEDEEDLEKLRKKIIENLNDSINFKTLVEKN